MNTEVLYDQSAQAILLAVILSLVPLGTCLIVGLVLSVFQAATQIQDQTLSFVPKLLGAVLVMWLTAPFFGAQANDFLGQLFSTLGETSDFSH